MAYLNLFVLAFILVFVNAAYIQPDQQNAPEAGTAIRDKFLQEKFAFLQNLLQKYNVDVEALQAKFQAARARGPKREVRDVSPIRENILKEKFDFLQNLLQKYNVDVEALQAKFQAARDRGPKREVRDVSPIRENILKEKFEYLQNLLQNFNVDLDALKAKFQAASGGRSKREVREAPEQPVDPLVGITDGILGAIASTLKSLVDSFLRAFNSNTGGVFRDLLISIQTLAFNIIDSRFPSNSTSYTSNLRL